MGLQVLLLARTVYSVPFSDTVQYLRCAYGHRHGDLEAGWGERSYDDEPKSLLTADSRTLG